MKLVLPYPPSVNAMWRAVVIGRKARVLLSAEGRSYRAAAALAAKAQGARPLDGPVVVALRAYRPRKVGDLDNTQKGVLDALRGIAYADDDQVVEIRATRHDDKARPRVEVEVWKVVELPAPPVTPWQGYDVCRGGCGHVLTAEEREAFGLCEGCGGR